MRSMAKWLVLAVVVTVLGAAPALAAKRSGAGGQSRAKTHAPKATTSMLAAPAAKGASAKGPAVKASAAATRTKPKATTPKAQPIKPAKSTSAAPTQAKAAKVKTNTAATTTAQVSTTQVTVTGTTWSPDNAVAQKLSTKSNLLARVKSSLPAGTDLNAATAGFKNFGQFVAAVNVSNNLGIRFADLKASMTGIDMTGAATGQPVLSLGQSIQQLKPGADATTEAHKAQTLADREIVTSRRARAKRAKFLRD